MSVQVGGGWRRADVSSNYSPNLTFLDRDPNEYDVQNYKTGDEIINTVTLSWWKLVARAGTSMSAGPLAMWVKVTSSLGSIETINGDTGSVSGTTVSFLATGKSGASTSFVGNNSTTMRLNLSDTNNNTTLGLNAGNPTGTYGFNTSLGTLSLNNITTGSSNIAIGYSAGNNYSSGETNNIVMGDPGTVGDQATIRIGAFGVQSANIQQGIYGVTPGGSVQTVVINSVGQLGSASAAPGVTIDGDSGSATGDPLTLTALNGGNNSGGTVTISASGSTLVLNLTDNASDQNTFIGLNAGNRTYTGGTGNAQANTAIGVGALAGLTTGNSNTAIGQFAMNNITTGIQNVSIGGQSLNNLTTGMQNVAVGPGNLRFITSGNGNVCVGYHGGYNYTDGSESDNLIFGDVSGVTGESGVMRLGNTTFQTTTYVAGIYGVSPGGTTQTVIVNSDGQLGSVAAAPSSSFILGGYFPSGTTTGVSDGLIFYTGGLGVPNGLIIPVSGTLSTMYVNVGVNTDTAPNTITIFLNGSPTSLVTTIPAATTGNFSNVVNTVSISAGDLIYPELSQQTTTPITGISFSFIVTT